ncbi:YtxH domain-containing protein [Mucilaginibacter panaciglaebae]|uniref:YtxH-like protein n=1 Tax=Mucilaginibacter panaciglaebae TaxID=502331 RepID=A0ABP7WNI6_9SPHI
MKNLFRRQNNTPLIILGVTGVAAAGAIAYLYLTDSGNNTRNKISDSLGDTIDKISHSLKDEFKNMASTFISDKTGVSRRAVKAVADHVSR